MASTRRILACLICCALVCGCDKETSPVSVDTPKEISPSDPQMMELFPQAQLAANRPTHLASDSLGNIYWVQESAAGQDILFVSGKDGIPQPSRLSSASIVHAMTQPTTQLVTQPATQAASRQSAPPSGNIESIAIDASGNVLFFFSGGVGNQICVCLGEYNPHDQSIQILADTQHLSKLAQMGASIGVARGQVIMLSIASDRPSQYLLLLHHSDAAVFFRFDLRSNLPGGQISLARAFDRLTGPSSLPDLFNDALEFAADGHGGLIMVDRKAAGLWHVTIDGSATRWTTLLGIPAQLSVPAILDGSNVVAFAPNGPPAVGFEGDGQSLRSGHFLKVRYPALLLLSADEIVPIVAAEDIRAPASLDVSKLRLQSVMQTPGAHHQMIAYDAQSGALLRLRLSAKIPP